MTPLKPGDRLDHFQLEALAARGGTACVYRATDLRNGHQVAIKVPHPEAECDVAFHQRFQREAAIGRELDHPALLKVFPGESPSRLYMVMEWVDGRLLRDVLAEDAPLPPERAVRIAVAICEALEEIHSRGIVHRDLKPENIMIGAGDRVKLIDFGIAAKSGARRLTFGRLSNIMGTADYISPEQVKNRRGDARSDLYSLGIILYEMLTGEIPFRGPNPLAIMNARLKATLRPPSQIVRGLPRPLDAVLGRTLEIKARDRYASAQELACDLQHLDRVAMPGSARTEDPRRQILIYSGLAMLPITIFILMLIVARLG